jgi:hypothetical protein
MIAKHGVESIEGRFVDCLSERKKYSTCGTLYNIGIARAYEHAVVRSNLSMQYSYATNNGIRLNLKRAMRMVI